MTTRNFAAPAATSPVRRSRRPSISVDALIAIRMSQGLSRSDLATRAGLHRTALWRIEEAGAQARTDTIRQLAKALNVPVTALLELDHGAAS